MNGHDESGASAVEYALIVNAIAAVIVIAAMSLGGATRDLFSDSCDTIESRVKTSAQCAP